MKRYILLMIALVAAIVASAQAPKPIEWRMTAKMTSETEGVVTIKATVTPGWHLYGMSLPASSGPKPTTMTFSHPTSLKWTSALKASAPTVEKQDAVFGVVLNWWDSNVTFTRTFTIENPENPWKIDLKVSFMGCNDETCLPPSTISLSRNVKPFKK